MTMLQPLLCRFGKHLPASFAGAEDGFSYCSACRKVLKTPPLRRYVVMLTTGETFTVEAVNRHAASSVVVYADNPKALPYNHSREVQPDNVATVESMPAEPLT